MPIYVQLLKWTDRGIAAVRQSPGRLDAAKAMLQDMGGKSLQFYMTLGEYDMVAVLEAPDDETMALFSLRISALGNVRTLTMPAFEEGAYRKIASAVP